MCPGFGDFFLPPPAAAADALFGSALASSAEALFAERSEARPSLELCVVGEVAWRDACRLGRLGQKLG